MKDRGTNAVTAQMIAGTNRPTLHGFVTALAASGTQVYTDEHAGPDGRDAPPLRGQPATLADLVAV